MNTHKKDKNGLWFSVKNEYDWLFVIFRCEWMDWYAAWHGYKMARERLRREKEIRQSDNVLRDLSWCRNGHTGKASKKSK